MRTERIYLGNTCHGGDKGRSYRSTGTYQIAVLIGLPHQFLCDDLHHGITIADDGFEFSFQSLFYDRRQIIAIERMRPIIADLSQHAV